MDISLSSRTWAGRVIDGKFPLLQWLGSSASSSVFLTEVEGHAPRKFALKLIAADTLDAEIQMSCWASTTALSHPRLMGLFHTGRCQIDNAWLIYAVTEYAEEFLSQVLAERPLTVAEAGEMLNPVVDALAYLHKNGAVHGRLKPANIMGVDDRLKISSRDFVSRESGAILSRQLAHLTRRKSHPAKSHPRPMFGRSASH